MEDNLRLVNSKVHKSQIEIILIMFRIQIGMMMGLIGVFVMRIKCMLIRMIGSFRLNPMLLGGCRGWIRLCWIGLLSIRSGLGAMTTFRASLINSQIRRRGNLASSKNCRIKSKDSKRFSYRV